jgi:hypothetical protein
VSVPFILLLREMSLEIFIRFDGRGGGVRGPDGFSLGGSEGLDRSGSGTEAVSWPLGLDGLGGTAAGSALGRFTGLVAGNSLRFRPVRCWNS